MSDDTLRAKCAPVPPGSFHSSETSGKPDLLTLEEALNRLAAFLEALDWMLIEPPEEPELIHLLMMEIRAELKRAVATCAQLITEQGRAG